MVVSELAKEIAKAYTYGEITGNQARKLCDLPPIKNPSMNLIMHVSDKAESERDWLKKLYRIYWTILAVNAVTLLCQITLLLLMLAGKL